jgi:hypothetical protein
VPLKVCDDCVLLKLQNFWTLSIVCLWSKTHDVSESGVCVRHQVKRHPLCWTQYIELVPIGPNIIGVFYLMMETDLSLRNVVFFDQRQTMDNAQKFCHFACILFFMLSFLGLCQKGTICITILFSSQLVFPTVRMCIQYYRFLFIRLSFFSATIYCIACYIRWWVHLLSSIWAAHVQYSYCIS